MRLLWLTQFGLTSMTKGEIVGIDVVMICLVNIDVNLVSWCWRMHWQWLELIATWLYVIMHKLVRWYFDCALVADLSLMVAVVSACCWLVGGCLGMIWSSSHVYGTRCIYGWFSACMINCRAYH